MTESEKVDMLLEIFGWDDTAVSRYHALRILRGARGEDPPLFDDFKVKDDRRSDK